MDSATMYIDKVDIIGYQGVQFRVLRFYHRYTEINTHYNFLKLSFKIEAYYYIIPTLEFELLSN